MWLWAAFHAYVIELCLAYETIHTDSITSCSVSILLFNYQLSPSCTRSCSCLIWKPRECGSRLWRGEVCLEKRGEGSRELEWKIKSGKDNGIANEYKHEEGTKGLHTWMSSVVVRSLGMDNVCGEVECADLGRLERLWLSPNSPCLSFNWMVWSTRIPRGMAARMDGWHMGWW